MSSPSLPRHEAVPLPMAPPAGVQVGLLQAVLDGLFEAACVVDSDTLYIVAHNDAALRLFGLDNFGLLGRHIEELSDTPEEHLFWVDVNQANRAGICSLDNNATLYSESLLKRADGSLCPVERRIAPISLPSGHPAWLVTWVNLSARSELQKELDQLAAELGSTFEGTADALLVTDREGAVRGCNQAYLRLFHLPEDLSPLDQRVPDALFCQAADPQALLDFLETLVAQPRRSAVRKFALLDGRILEHRTLPQYARGEAIGRIHGLRDLSEQVAAQARLQMVADVFDTLGDAIFVLDGQGAVVESNRAANVLSGMSASILQGQALSVHLRDPHEEERLALALTSLQSQSRWDGEMEWRSERGATPVQVQLIGIRDAGDSGGTFVAIVRDLSEHKAQQSALQRLSNCDPVTGLPNRSLLTQRVDTLISAQAQDKNRFALLSVGLDRFKHISNALGHHVADGVLVEAARRLSDCVRQNDMVAHLGHGAFAIMLAGAEAPAVERVARRILESLATEMTIEDLHFNIGASIGAAVYPVDGSSINELLTNADSALQEVQTSGQGVLRFYQPRMNSDLRAKVQMDHAMREGLRANRFHLHYQAQFSLQDGALVGAEALLRWSDPVHGEVSPARFIPVAEGKPASSPSWATSC